MLVYQTFLKAARAKLPTVLLYWIIFTMIAFVLSFRAQDEINRHFETASARICIIDNDQSTASRALSDFLSSRHTLVSLGSCDRETLQDNLYYYRVDYVLTIPAGFEEKLFSGEADALVESAKLPDSACGYFIDRQADGYISTLAAASAIGRSPEDAAAAADRIFQELPEASLVQFEEKSSASHKQMYYFFQYLPYVILMMIMQGLTPVLLAFRKTDIEKRNLCSSIHPNVQNAQIGLGCATFALASWLAFLIPGIFIYGPEQFFSSSGLLCLLNSAVFVLIATAATLLLGTFPLGGEALSMVSNVIGLGMSFLCGVFVPQWYLGDAVLSVSRFLPAYWYIRITNMLAGFSDETLSMHTYRTCIGIQLLFAAAVFAVYLASARFHRRAREG